MGIKRRLNNNKALSTQLHIQSIINMHALYKSDKY